MFCLPWALFLYCIIQQKTNLVTYLVQRSRPCGVNAVWHFPADVVEFSAEGQTYGTEETIYCLIHTSADHIRVMCQMAQWGPKIEEPMKGML